MGLNWSGRNNNPSPEARVERCAADPNEPVVCEFLAINVGGFGSHVRKRTETTEAQQPEEPLSKIIPVASLESDDDWRQHAPQKNPYDSELNRMRAQRDHWERKRRERLAE